MTRTVTIILLSVLTVGVWAAEPNSATASEELPSAGSVAGTIDYQGEVPKFHVADNTGRARPLLQVDKHGHGLQYVAVYLEAASTTSSKRGEGRHPTEHEAASRVPPPAVKIDQLDETFTPHLIAVRVGQRVIFGNHDNANHNVRSASLVPENQFNIVVGPMNEYAHAFRADRKSRPVGLLCDIHPWMRGWIYVFDHPHFAVTDGKGKYLIDDVPPGRYRLVVRQPDAGFAREREIEVVAGKATRIDFTFRANDVKRFATESTSKKRH